LRQLFRRAIHNAATIRNDWKVVNPILPVLARSFPICSKSTRTPFSRWFIFHMQFIFHMNLLLHMKINFHMQRGFPMQSVLHMQFPFHKN